MFNQRTTLVQSDLNEAPTGSGIELERGSDGMGQPLYLRDAPFHFSLRRYSRASLP